MRRGSLVVLSSPSGGGKTTVVRALLRRVPRLTRSVSVTTRPPRPSERTGREYWFISTKRFARLRAQGGLLEWARVHQACYGTPRRAVERALARGRDVVLSIDVQGARQIRRRCGRDAVLVFLVPPSRRELKRRLLRRGTESAEGIRTRLAAATRELACRRWYDYAVVNDRLADAIAQLAAIVTAERVRVTRERRA